MTRKDYILIADAIRELLTDIERGATTAGCDRTRNIITGEHLGVRHAALRLADRLQQENTRFEMGTFLKACGIAA